MNVLDSAYIRLIGTESVDDKHYRLPNFLLASGDHTDLGGPIAFAIGELDLRDTAALSEARVSSYAFDDDPHDEARLGP